MPEPHRDTDHHQGERCEASAAVMAGATPTWKPLESDKS